MAKTERIVTTGEYDIVRYLEDDADYGIAAGSEFLVRKDA